MNFVIPDLKNGVALVHSSWVVKKSENYRCYNECFVVICLFFLLPVLSSFIFIIEEYAFCILLSIFSKTLGNALCHASKL